MGTRSLMHSAKGPLATNSAQAERLAAHKAGGAFELGKEYFTQGGEAVRFVSLANAGEPYETIVDEQGRHRYTQPEYLVGRLTGSAHDYSDLGNVRAALLQSSSPPESQAGGDLTEIISDLRGKGDAAYLRYIDLMKRNECLGVEWKLDNGKFTIENLHAHVDASKQLGIHRGFFDAAEAIERALNQRQAVKAEPKDTTQ